MIGSGGFAKSAFATYRDVSYPGQYTGYFYTNAAGNISISVKVGGDVVFEGSTTILPGSVVSTQSEVTSPLFPLSTVYTSTQSVASEVIVVTRDVYGNKLITGGLLEDISLELHRKNQNFFIPLSLTDNGDGTYSSPVTVKEAGDYVVKATIMGEQVSQKELELVAGYG